MEHELPTGRTESGAPRIAPPQRAGAGSPAVAKAAATPFSWQTLALLRSLPLAVTENGSRDGLVAAAARMVAEDTHRAELPFARGLIALKQTWSGLAEVRLLPLLDAQDVLAALVTASITAYFAPPVGLEPARPVSESRERAESVTRTLREFLSRIDSDALAADDSGEERDGSEMPDPELEGRLLRAVGSMPAEDVRRLTEALGSLHDALRARPWRRATRRLLSGGAVRGPRH
ncbi:MAG: hypothetical protein ACXW05_13430 [Gemmatirosa sp.]